jgi:thymidylate synthase
MGYLLEGNNEMCGLHHLLQLILEKGSLRGNYLEVLNCLLTIGFDPEAWEDFLNFEEEYLQISGEIGRIGWNKASRVYTSTKDRPSKPSYRKRLISYPDKARRSENDSTGLNQIEKISFELSKKPGFSNLSFVFLRPADLHDQFRPGYVPCPIAGDFKFRDGRLNLSVMFRTIDAFGVGYADIYYLRHLQKEIFDKARLLTERKDLLEGNIGDLNLYFSRAYIEKKKKS